LLFLNTMSIYLDSGASTRLDPDVRAAIKPYFSDHYANAASLHKEGQIAHSAVEKARETIAKSIGAKSHEIVFTSGGTESNNFALKGVGFANKTNRNHIIISSVEHECVLNAARFLERQGFKVTALPVDKQGFVSFDALKKTLSKQTLLVSIIHGNNEVGTINDLEKIGALVKEHGALFHTDACQSYTKVPVNVDMMNLDLVSINAHKIHGPKGVGALYIRGGTAIEPLLHGGGQERGFRSGTLNIPGIVGFGMAVEAIKHQDFLRMAKLRDLLIDELLSISGARLNGPRENRLCNNVNISFKAVDGNSLLLQLSDQGIMVSTGSACSSEKMHESHVLNAMRVPKQHITSAIRFSLGKYTTKAEIEQTIRTIKKLIKHMREVK